jgi:lipid II:glycine glycyltransferase (peptidoglycan interpeptide bridge formation enzyme)
VSFDVLFQVFEGLEDPEWDGLVWDVPDGHYTQTSLWARVKLVQGWRVFRILLKKADETIAGTQVFVRPVPLLGSIGYISKGPIFRVSDRELYRRCLQEIQKQLYARGVQYFALQPPDHGEELVPLLKEMGFEKSSQGDIEKPATILIDMSADPETILSTQIKHKKRNAIRRSQKTGLSYRQGTKADLEFFAQLHQKTGERNRFEVQSKKFFEFLWDVFEPRNQLALLIAEYEGEPLAASLVLAYKETAYGYRIGWSGKHSNLRPNEGVIWSSILWAKAQGYRWFDFGGIDTRAAQAVLSGQELPNHLLNTYSEYKLHYTDQVVMYPETYEYFCNPLLGRLYRRVFRFVNPVLTFGYRLYRRR